jgi:hypothetical protein
MGNVMVTAILTVGGQIVFVIVFGLIGLIVLIAAGRLVA